MTTIVMTGGSSGLGAVAAHHLVEAPDVRLLLASRSGGPGGWQVDLASLDSVRSLAERLLRHLAGDGIDALVLNAGTILPDDRRRSIDGHEMTFAVNHLAHHLLVRLLLPAVAEGGRIVITTSGTHDPATGAGLAVPRQADAQLLAEPERDPDRHSRPKEAGQHAYTASKLCNVLTVRSLRHHPHVATRGITVLAYDPGQVFGTGLARDLAIPLRFAWKALGTPLGAPLRRLKPELNTPRSAGQTLSDLALGRSDPPEGRCYAALRRGRLTWPDPSALALRDDLAAALWRDSGRLAGAEPGAAAPSPALRI